MSTHALFVDGAQNSVLGVGVTPEAWEVDATAIQVGGIGAFWGKTAQAASSGTFMTNNVYDKPSTGQAYIVTDEASLYNQDDGNHIWQTAASGSADAAISFSERFRIAQAGMIGIGGANYGSDGQVLTSTGGSSAPAWEEAGGGITIAEAIIMAG